jgi:hypothetical protein
LRFRREDGKPVNKVNVLNPNYRLPAFPANLKKDALSVSTFYPIFLRKEKVFVVTSSTNYLIKANSNEKNFDSCLNGITAIVVGSDAGTNNISR